jgi:hypothetical protein
MKIFEKINIIKEMLVDKEFSTDIDNLINKYLYEHDFVQVISLDVNQLKFSYEKRLYKPDMILNKVLNGPFFSWEYYYLSSEKIDIKKIKQEMINREYNYVLNKVSEAKEDYDNIKKKFEHKFKKQIRNKKLNNLLDT